MAENQRLQEGFSNKSSSNESSRVSNPVRMVLENLSNAFGRENKETPGKVQERELERELKRQRKEEERAVKVFMTYFSDNHDPQITWSKLDEEQRDKVLKAFRENPSDFPGVAIDFLQKQKTTEELAQEVQRKEDAKKAQEQQKKDSLLGEVDNLVARKEEVADQQRQIRAEYQAQSALVTTAQAAVDEQKAVVAALEAEKSAPVTAEKAAELLTTNETGLPQVEKNLRDQVIEMTAAVATGNVTLEQLLRLADAGTQDMIIRVWIGEQNPDQAPELAKTSREIIAEGVNTMLEAAKEKALASVSEIELKNKVEEGLTNPQTITAIGTALTGEVSFGEALSRYYLAEKAARRAAETPGLSDEHKKSLAKTSEESRLALVQEMAKAYEKKGQVLTAGGLEILQQFLGGQTFGYVSENGTVQRILTSEETEALSRSAQKTLTVQEEDQFGRKRYVEHKLVSVTDVFGPETKNVEQASALFAKVVETMLSGSGEAQRDLVASVSSQSVESVLTELQETKKTVPQNSSKYQELYGQETILSAVLVSYRQTYQAVMTEAQVDGINYIQERIKNEDPAAVLTATELAGFIESSNSAPLRRLATIIRNRAGMYDYDPALTSLKDAYEAAKMLSGMEMKPEMKSTELIELLRDKEYRVRIAQERVKGQYQKEREELREAGKGDRKTLFEKTRSYKDAKTLLTNLHEEISTLSTRQTEIGTRITEIINLERDINARTKLIEGEISQTAITEQFDNPISVVRQIIDGLKKESQGVNRRYTNLMKKQEAGELSPEQQEELLSVQEKVSGYKSQIETEEAKLRRLQEAKEKYEKERKDAAEALAKQKEELIKEKTQLFVERGENLERLNKLTKTQGDDGLTDVERAERALADAKATLIAAREAYIGTWKPKIGDLRFAMNEEINQLARKRAVIEQMLYGVQVTAGIAGVEGREKPTGTVELDNYTAEVVRHVEDLKKAQLEAELKAAQDELSVREQQLQEAQTVLNEIIDRANQVPKIDVNDQIAQLKQQWLAAGLDEDEFNQYVESKNLG